MSTGTGDDSGCAPRSQGTLSRCSTTPAHRSTSRTYWPGFFFSSRRRHTRLVSDWSSDVCSSDLYEIQKIESALRVRLDQLELRESDLERFDMVAVLDFVEAVRGPVVVPAAVVPFVIIPLLL